jgi:hypothetical protein
MAGGCDGFQVRCRRNRYVWSRTASAVPHAAWSSSDSWTPALRLPSSRDARSARSHDDWVRTIQKTARAGPDKGDGPLLAQEAV